MNSRAMAVQALNHLDNGNLLMDALDAAVARLPEGDIERQWVQEVVYGSTRWRMKYDAYIRQLCRGEMPTDITLNVLRVGLHQLFAMRTPPHAAINETVKLAREVLGERRVKFVNALLRSAQRAGETNLTTQVREGLTPRAWLAVEHSHPEWLVAEIAEMLSRCNMAEELEANLAHNNSLASVQVCVTNTAALDTLRKNPAVRQEIVPGCLSILSGFNSKMLGPQIWVQDLASQAVTRAFAHAVDPAASRVLDACAAPGGKSRLLRSLLKESTNLESLDVSEARLKKLMPYVEGSNWSYKVGDFSAYEDGGFDAILLDAPCSSLGSVRRKPDTKYRSSPEDLDGYARLQKRLLTAAWDNLVDGGVVAYVTCTPTRAETDAVIRESLLVGWEVMNAAEYLSEVSPGLKLCERPNGALLWGHRNNSDTMFLSLLRKPKNS